LLEATADVVVVSPSLTDGLRQWAITGTIHHISRAFCDADVERAFASGGSRRHLLRSSTEPRIPLPEGRLPIPI
jgi:hypothetical protein